VLRRTALIINDRYTPSKTGGDVTPARRKDTKKINSASLHSRSCNGAFMSLLSVAILFCAFGWTGRAFAEGSRSLYPASYPTVCGTGTGQGCRADLDLEMSYGTTSGVYVGGVNRSGFLYVYAQAGEYILLGSRARASADIYVYKPQNFGVPGAEIYNVLNPGTPDFKCSTGPANPGETGFSGASPIGLIPDRAHELAGPNSADNSVQVTNGFTPCAYQAPVTGSYGVLFFANYPSAANCGNNPPDGNVSPPGTDNCGVSAWDVTVRANATSTTDINGSLYTYAFIGYTGDNSRPMYSSLYYVTRDGYRYRQDLDGLDGNGYALYSNSLGFLDSGQPLYRDVRGNDAMVSTNLPLGVTTQTAENPTFFNDISPSGANASRVNTVLSSLNIPLVPPSPTVSNVDFVGNVTGATTYLGTGGTFTFDTTNTITYQIVVSLDGINFDPANPNNKTLTGLAPAGSHTVVWDGTNNSGANFPAGGPYPFQVSGRNGEVHFPMIDVENNYFGGPTVTRLNGTGAPDTTIYYDDRGYVLSSGDTVGTLDGLLCPTATPTQPVPAYNLVGTDSSASYRTWGVLTGTSNTNADCTSTNAWGDAKAVNLWTYYSYTPSQQTLSIIAVNVDAATTVTGPATATAGGTVQGTFRFSNNGTGTAHGLTYTMTLTPGLGTVTFGNLPGGATASYNNATGAVTFAGFPTTLAAGMAVTTSPMTYSYAAPASSVTVSTGIATTDTDGVSSNNNDSVTTYIGTVDVATIVSVLSYAAPAAAVTGNILFTNYGANAASGVTYSATIGDGSFHPPLITFTSIPAGGTPSYDSSTGAVTFTGLSSTLGGSQSFNIGFSYMAPSSGTIPVTSSITTISTDNNVANNNSNAGTVIGPDLTITKSDSGNFYQGQTGAQYTITVSNVGGATNGTQVSVTDTLPSGLTATAISGTGWTCVLGTLSCTRSDVLAAGSSYPPITLTVNVSQTAGSPLLNTATVSGGGDTNSANNTASDLTAVITGPDLIVTKSHSGNFYRGQNSTNTPPNPAQYAIAVSNIGGTPTSGTITVTDTLPNGLTFVSGGDGGVKWNNCTASGQTVTCTSTTGYSIPAGGSANPITLTVNVSGTAGSPLTNSATVSGGGETNTGNDNATDSTTVVASTWDLAITKTPTGAFTQGQNAQYTFHVCNVGTARTPNGTITLTDTLPAGLTYVSQNGGTAWGTTCRATGQVVTCTSGTRLNAGTCYSPDLVLTVNVASNAAPTLINTAGVSHTAAEAYTGNNTANASTTINQSADLTVTKSHTGNFYRGQTGAQYTIVVANTGGSPTDGTTVTVTDTLPGGMTATAISGAGWSCTASTLTCTRSDVLAAGAGYSPITLTVNVAGNAGSPLTNSVTAVGGGGGTSTDTDPTTVNTTAPDLTVTKSHTGNFSQGQTGATYTITVSNVGNASTTGTITVTDTLPAGLTYVSGTGTGWFCDDSGLIVTCTSTTTIAARGAGNPITLTVNVSATAGSPLVNTVTVSGGGETYTANDTATDPTIVNPSPDLTIAITHSSVFYLGAVGLPYTITVTNGGPGNVLSGSTVTVTDTLPPGLTATAISGTGWSCTLSTLTCTRSDALAAGSSYPAITLTVNVSNSAPYTITNTAIVSITGQTEANPNNNIAQDTTAIMPTLVVLTDFWAYSENGDAIVQWETASELNTLGFDLLRLDPRTGTYVKVNSGLLPSILKPHRGGIYAIRDRGASPGGVYTYKLVEVETSGNRLSYGPFTVTVGSNPGENSGLTASSNYVRREKDESALHKARISARKAAVAAAGTRETVQAAVGNRIKITVTDPGIYYVDSSSIASMMGMRRDAVSAMIRQGLFSLTTQGQQVAYLPAKNSAGLYFYGTGINSVYTKDNVYWIDKARGTFMRVVKGRGPLPASGGESFADTAHFEEDLVPWESLFNDPNDDYWFWDQIYSSDDYSDPPKNFSFQAPGLSEPQTDATIQIHLFGGSDAGILNDHDVIISLNGQQIAEDRWSGQTAHTVTTTAHVTSGQNTLTITGKNQPGYSSFVLINSFDVTYQESYASAGNELFFRGDGNQTVTIGGFSSPDIVVFDITNPLTPVLNSAVTVDPASDTVSLVPADPATPYVAVSGGGVMKASSSAVTASSLSSRANGADYILIVPDPSFVTAAQSLASYRAGQGMKTMIVNLDDIMNEFNYGISSPEAIKTFLSFAHSNWRKSPRYVILAGDGSMDYKNNLGFGGSLIPSPMVPTPYGLAASDNYLADINGDYVPEIAIGRLPVVSPDELNTVINKIKTYEGTAGYQALLLADFPDEGGNFIADSNEIANLFPSGLSGYKVTPIYLSDPSNIINVRAALFGAINAGQGFFNYLGHGGPEEFSNWGLLTTDDLPLLTNASLLPIMTAMTCIAGNFSDPYEVVLNEALVLKADGGVAAAWSPTGLSDDSQANILNGAFYDAIFRGGKQTIGDAVIQALSVYKTKGTMPFMMDIYNILGDPALKIK
jgi:uncharacterized repeat protein (TIGR01451 family)